MSDWRPRWQRSPSRPVIVDARRASDFALIRGAAHAWGDTRYGADLRVLLAELDGGPAVTADRLASILTSGYERTEAGDGVGDDINSLIEAVGERRRARGRI